MKTFYIASLTAALLTSACQPASESKATDHSDKLCIQSICYAANVKNFTRNLPRGLRHDLSQDKSSAYAQLSAPVTINGLDFIASYVQFDSSAQRQVPINIALFMMEDVKKTVGNCEAAVSGLAETFSTQGLRFTGGPHRHSFLESITEAISNADVSADIITTGPEQSRLTRTTIKFDDGQSVLHSATSERAPDGAMLHIETMNADGQCDIFMTMSTRQGYGAYDLLSEF